jgi:hypothetical protein
MCLKPILSYNGKCLLFVQTESGTPAIVCTFVATEEEENESTNI